MKDLKHYLKESILDDIDVQIENTDEMLKSAIINWLKNNVKNIIRENKFKFDFNTAPITVDYDDIIKFKTNIKSLTSGLFQWGKVGNIFDCYNCKSLESLKGAPKEVGGDFWCIYCDSLKSLEGAPNKVGGDFYCNGCESLQSLEGAPNKVGGDFCCNDCNKLVSLKGAPKEVERDFYCVDCGKQFTEEDVEKVSKVKGKIYYEEH